jgi:hypothetical protein
VDFFIFITVFTEKVSVFIIPYMIIQRGIVGGGMVGRSRLIAAYHLLQIVITIVNKSIL